MTTATGGLGLVENEHVGWRIRAEWLNWTVVQVKRHGAASRHAGQEYDIAMGYYKDVEQAIAAILRFESWRAGKLGQQEVLAKNGTRADLDALSEAIAGARAAALEAIQALRGDLGQLGTNETEFRRTLARLTRTPAISEEATTESNEA
jgi:hypothetical protein